MTLPNAKTKPSRPIDPKIRDYISWKLSSGDPIAPRTAQQYGFDLDRLGRYLQDGNDPPFYRMYDATNAQIRDFIAHLSATNARTSLRRKLAAIDGFYQYLVLFGERKDKSNPAEGIDLGKGTRRSKELFVLSRDDMRRLLQAPMDPEIRKAMGKRGDRGIRDRALLYFFYSGPKRHEMTTTKATDFDASTQSIRVRDRRVPLSKEAAEAISAYVDKRPHSKSKALFLTVAKSTLTLRQAWAIVKDYIEACGFRSDTDVETLRRSFAVHALEDGVYVLDVLSALGNVSISALHDYAKIAREGFLRRQKSTETAGAEVPYSRFLKCVHDIRIAATNIVLGSNDFNGAEETINRQIERLKREWPSFVDEGTFNILRVHAASKTRRDYQMILADDLTNIESHALNIFMQNQQKRQQAGFIALLHPRVTQAALRHYLDHEHRVAILDAMLALTEMIRDKTGLDDDGLKIARVFKYENPILAVNSLETQSDRDEQAGVHKLIMGAYEALRNPNAHDFRNISELESAQNLVLISCLMRWVESARLITESPAA